MKHVHKQALLTSVTDCVLCQSRENKLEMFRQLLVQIASTQEAREGYPIERFSDEWQPCILKVRSLVASGHLREDSECPV